jgi:hypothetical protein
MTLHLVLGDVRKIWMEVIIHEFVLVYVYQRKILSNLFDSTKITFLNVLFNDVASDYVDGGWMNERWIVVLWWYDFNRKNLNTRKYFT